MTGMIVGPMSPELFITVLMQRPEGVPPMPDVDFDDITTDITTEAQLYPFLVRKFEKVTPGFEWFISAEDTGSNKQLCPGLGLVERGRWDDESDGADSHPGLADRPINISAPPPLPILAQHHEPKSKTRSEKSLVGEIVATVMSFGWQTGDHSALPSPPPPQPDHRPEPSLSRPFDWKRCEFGCAVKMSDDDDAFTDTNPRSVEDPSDKPRQNRDRLISLMKEQASRQHRTCIFQLYIFGDWARLLFYDRSGGIVSQKFNYKNNPKLLATFLWEYSHLSQEQRGWDPTVVAASPAETDLLETMMRPFIERVGRPSESDLSELKCEVFKDTLNETYPTYKLTIASPEYSADLLIRCPFVQSLSPFGSATRGYLAYDLGRGDVVFLKDNWRTHSMDRLAESEIYDILKGCGVEHLPNVLHAADVLTSHASRQETFVHKHTQNRKRSTSDSQSHRSHVHCRIVQSVAFPISSCRESREFVQALRDALVAIKQAYEHGIMHCDISSGNVMISPDGRGILNDWDHSRVDPRFKALQDAVHTVGLLPRTGTWHFMSIHQLKNSKHQHTVVDDLESVFWVLMWGALHYFKHAHPDESLLNMFGDIELRSGETMATATGGYKKKEELVDRTLENLQFVSAPLNDLIVSLALEWVTIYNNETSRFPEVRKIAEAKYNQLSDVGYMIEQFDAALARTDWPTKDRIPDQFPVRSETLPSTGQHRTSQNSSTTYGLNQHNPRAVGIAGVMPIQHPPESSRPFGLAPQMLTRLAGIVYATFTGAGTALYSAGLSVPTLLAASSTFTPSYVSASLRRKRSEGNSSDVFRRVSKRRKIGASGN